LVNRLSCANSRFSHDRFDTDRNKDVGLGLKRRLLGFVTNCLPQFIDKTQNFRAHRDQNAAELVP